MSKNPKVVIVILNWNGYEDTIECLDSLQIVSYQNLLTIVVDNGSTDGSVEEIRKAHPHVKIIRMLNNTGFTGGSNAGFCAATDEGADYIFLLNNDTIIDDEMLVEHMVSYSETHADVGIVSPVVLNYPEKKVWFMGGHLDRNTGIIILEKRGEEYKIKPTETTKSCTFLYGCALFIKAELLAKVHGFYAPYFLTSEESELCVRAVDMGFKLVLLENTYLYHKVSKSMSRGSFLWAYFLYRNKLIFIKRNARSLSATNVLKVIIYYCRALAGFLKRRNFSGAMGMLRGVLDFFLGREGKGYFENRL